MTQDQDASTILSQANTAFMDEDFSHALSLYNSAVEASPSNPDAYLKRAACHHQLAHFHEALSDAKAAVMFAAGDAKTLAKAHIRQGMGLLDLGKQQEALEAFLEAKRLGGDEQTVKRWIEKCEKLGAVGERTLAPSLD